MAIEPSNDEELIFEDESISEQNLLAPWELLIVDDEEEIHQVTKVALRDFSFEGRQLRFLDAYTGADARRVIKENPNVAMILLDVVMEEDDAGLKFVRYLRDESSNHLTRVVLRTGQPGQAPERDVIINYDINDYKNKTELSRQKLFTTVVASLRSFRDLVLLAESREQAEKSLQAQISLTTAASHFIPHDILKLLNKEHITEIRLGENVDMDLAIMFTDIRGFTTMTEQMTPQENFDFINDYLGRTGPLIRLHHGFILKYLGDGMMAAFPGGVEAALLAGIDTLKTLAKFNEDRRLKGKPPIQIGLGVHSGPMRIGIVGEAGRMQGDAMSDHVNLTARLESLTKEYGVPFLLSEAAVQSLKDPSRFHMRALGVAHVKGREQGISIYEIFDADPPEQIEKKEKTRAPFAQALERYLSGDFWEAGLLFKQLQAINPADTVVDYYLSRSAELLTQDRSQNKKPFR